jgi:hypothetical protein
MFTEGELRSNLDDSEKVRELQDKVADMKAEVRETCGPHCPELCHNIWPICFILLHTFLLVM